VGSSTVPSGARWRGTRDSNSVMPGLEFGALPIEPVPRGAGPGSRTRKHLILSQAAIPIRQSGNGASGRIRTGKHGGLMSADCITQTLVGSAGVEPTSKRGDRVQGYNLLPLPLGQLPKLVRLSKIEVRGGEQATRTLVSFGERLFSKQGGRPTAHALRRDLPIKSR